MTPWVVITSDAAKLLSQLQDKHGPLMFHQSGGCCDGSSPMCYPDGDFIVGDRDVLLGLLDVGPDGVPVWISGPQFQTWKHTQLVIDVVPGRGGGFSLEAPEGVRFLSRGRTFSDDENTALAAAPAITIPAINTVDPSNAPPALLALKLLKTLTIPTPTQITPSQPKM